MTIFDRFWVPESEIPPSEILVIFLIIHILLLLLLVINYNYIKAKLSRSNYEYADLPEVSTTLLTSLRRIYIGLSLITLDNILTHLIALVDRRDAYFSVGADSTLIVVGFALFFINISRFVTEILRIPKSFNPRPLPFIRTMKYGYLLAFVTVIFLQSLGVNTRLISWIFILSTGLMGIFFTMEFYIVFNSQLTDPVNKLRTIITGFLGIGMIALLIFAINFIPPRDLPSSEWPTRDARVEILIFGTDIWVLYTATMIIVMVILPRNIRLLFNITDEEFDLFRDERIDLDWERLDHWDLKDASSGEFVTALDKLIFVDPELKDLTHTKNISSNGYFLSTSDFKDKYIDDYMKDRYDIILISLKDQYELTEVFDFIDNYYDFKLQMHEYLQVNSFVYKLEGYSCGMIVGIPSFWNSSHKLWLILGSDKNIKNVIELYAKFQSFFSMIAEEEQLFMVAKFPLSDDQVMNIPPLPTDTEVPDFRYLIFL